MGNTIKNVPTMGQNGIVVSPHHIASKAGLAILKRGGSAVEAAIAVAATLSVVYPHMNSIGGDNFWLIYNARDKELKALNASGRSGIMASIKYYLTKGLSQIPARGYLAANTVPGAISGWGSAYQYAQKSIGANLAWADLLETAIEYSANGFPLSVNQEYWTKINIDPDDISRNLQRFEGFRETFLKANGQPYVKGELFKQHHLANTLAMIAREGPECFYTGEISKKIVTELQANGGLLTLADFAAHKAEWVKPITTKYRGFQAYNCPPNSQGVASLSILNILNNFDIKSCGDGTADYYHLIIEATKQAFADRDKWVTDPAFIDIPLDYLLSVQHGREQAARINRNQAAIDPRPLDPKGDTVWLGTIDKEGNAVSLIQSIYHEFGSGIIAKDTGVVLQNRGSFFSLDPDHVNCLAPRKRTFHTLNPAMLFREEKPYLIYGTMGGEGQPQTQAAIVTKIIDFGQNVQAAVNAPRWLYGRTWGAASNDLKIEGRIAKDVAGELAARGHLVNVVDDYSDLMGHAGAIQIEPITGMKYGGVDPRSDGTAEGY